jgi:hypothetical protein
MAIPRSPSDRHPAFAALSLDQRLGKIEKALEHSRIRPAISGITGSGFSNSADRKIAGNGTDSGPGKSVPDGPAKQQVALAGPDGEAAATLLREAKRQGSQTLYHLSARALKRWMETGQRGMGRLFDDAEMMELTRAFAATLATSDLLGRARIREQQEDENGRSISSRAGEDNRHNLRRAGSSDSRSQQNGRSPAHGFDPAVQQYTEQDLFTPAMRVFHSFADQAPLKPFAPAKALAYFKRLVPSLDVHPERFGDLQQRKAFTLAHKTGLEMVKRVQDAITKAMETGKNINGSAIDDILDNVGVGKQNDSYSEMCFRTNMQDSYQSGAIEELHHPDVINDFPAWQWLGIRDGRQRHSHEIHFDKYYPNTVTFHQVRDRNGYDGFNDRCNFRPVHKAEWQRLQEKGIGFATFSEIRGDSLQKNQRRISQVDGGRDSGEANERINSGLPDKFSEQLELAIYREWQSQPSGFPSSLAGLHVWRPLGGKGGGNARLVSVAGRRYVAKDCDGVSAEQQDAAEKVYTILGIPVPKGRFYPEKQVRLQEWIEGVPYSQIVADDPEKARGLRDAIRRGFLADVLLRNIDAIGNGDNILVVPEGYAFRVDFDRTLAQRGPLTADVDARRLTKPGPKDPPLNKYLYGDIDEREVQEQLLEVLKRRGQIVQAMPEGLRQAMEDRIEVLRGGGMKMKEGGEWR